MPNPPTISLASKTATSITLNLTGDAGSTQQLYYAITGTPNFVLGPSVTGNGSTTISSLTQGASYQIVGISTLAGVASLPTALGVSLAAVTSVIQALINKYASNSALVAVLTNGLWYGEVPDKTDPPYGFLCLDRTRYVHYIADATIEVSRVCFHIIAVTAATTESIVQQVKAAFDWKATDVVFTDGTSSCINVVPVAMDIQSAMARWKDGNLLYRGMVHYDVLTQRYP